MKCICCNREIISKLSIRNLFKRNNEVLCDYCLKTLNIDIELSILPISYNVVYAFRVFSNYNYCEYIYYSKYIFEIYELLKKVCKDHLILHFDNEKSFLNAYNIIDDISNLYPNIIIIYH